MATLSAIVSDYLREDKTRNVRIRITHNRQISYFSTHFFLSIAQISKNLKKIKDTEALDSINLYISRLRQEINMLPNINNITAKGIKEYFEQKKNSAEYIDLIELINTEVLSLESSSRKSTAAAYKALLNHLKAYTRLDTINIAAINRNFVEKFENYLRSNNIGSRGREANLSTLRAIFKSARARYNDEDSGVIRVANNPFEFYKIKKATPPAKRALTIAQIKAIRDYKHIHPRHISITPRAELARDIFMLSFYLCGTNSIDLFRLGKLNNGRANYNRSKTMNRRADNAYISIRAEAEALEIINKYRSRSKNFLLDLHTRYVDERTLNANLNKGLKQIGAAVGISDLEFYAARHTWATIADNICNIPIAEIGFCLNHAEGEIVTYKYIKKDFSKIDRINRQVMDILK